MHDRCRHSAPLHTRFPLVLGPPLRLRNNNNNTTVAGSSWAGCCVCLYRSRVVSVWEGSPCHLPATVLYRYSVSFFSSFVVA